MRPLLTGAGDVHPMGTVLAVSLIGVVSLIAVWLPTRRVTGIDPGEVLRAGRR